MLEVHINARHRDGPFSLKNHFNRHVVQVVAYEPQNFPLLAIKKWGDALSAGFQLLSWLPQYVASAFLGADLFDQPSSD